MEARQHHLKWWLNRQANYANDEQMLGHQAVCKSSQATKKFYTRQLAAALAVRQLHTQQNTTVCSYMSCRTASVWLGSTQTAAADIPWQHDVVEQRSDPLRETQGSGFTNQLHRLRIIPVQKLARGGFGEARVVPPYSITIMKDGCTQCKMGAAKAGKQHLSGAEGLHV